MELIKEREVFEIRAARKIFQRIDRTEKLIELQFAEEIFHDEVEDRFFDFAIRGFLCFLLL